MTVDESIPLKAALLSEQLADDRVRCHVCQRRCTIAPGQRGYCGTRVNQQGTLFTLIYGQVSSACLDPIEKKPLYHFYPGTRVFSLGSVGCSFSCPGCQNWQLSRRSLRETGTILQRMTPAQAVQGALSVQAAGLCWTYNDPAIWVEYTLDCARLARQHGLYTAYVTNGTATREHLDVIAPYLDAYRVDIKAFSAASYRAIAGFADVQGIFDAVSYARNHWQLHVECVTNVTPTLNDSDEELRGIAGWIARTLGADTPWHVTRFFPHADFASLPVTPVERLARARTIAAEEGLRYVYLGNLARDDSRHTRCARCHRVLIMRDGYDSTRVLMTGGTCPQCGERLYGRWATDA